MGSRSCWCLWASHADLFHCTSWEAYVQLLKRMFAMTNYKNAPVYVTFQKCARGTNTSCARTQGERLLDAAGGASKVCGGFGVYGDDACCRLLARSTLDCSLASSIEYQAMAGARQPRQQKKRSSHETSFYMLICYVQISNANAFAVNTIVDALE